ncbi:MAG: hypothetical protein CM15mV121_400 [uncultured marine virus]|nr:MAG: hypothetical protein CM15mV121_400 [uncultured marine virus]
MKFLLVIKICSAYMVTVYQNKMLIHMILGIIVLEVVHMKQ